MTKRKNEIKPSHTEIAALAYRMFEQEGRVHGRHLDHWRQAELLLKSDAAQQASKASGEKGRGPFKVQFSERKAVHAPS